MRTYARFAIVACFTATGVMKNEILLTIFYQRLVISPLKNRGPSAGPRNTICNRV